MQIFSVSLRHLNKDFRSSGLSNNCKEDEKSLLYIFHKYTSSFYMYYTSFLILLPMICSSDIEFYVVCLLTPDRSCLNPGKYFATSPQFGKKLSTAIIYLVINHLLLLVLCIIMLVLVNGCSAATLSMRVLFCGQP